MEGYMSTPQGVTNTCHIHHYMCHIHYSTCHIHQKVVLCRCTPTCVTCLARCYQHLPHPPQGVTSTFHIHHKVLPTLSTSITTFATSITRCQKHVVTSTPRCYPHSPHPTTTHTTSTTRSYQHLALPPQGVTSTFHIHHKVLPALGTSSTRYSSTCITSHLSVACRGFS